MTNIIEQNDVINWLLEGDAAVRWQTMRDILNLPARQWKAHQRRVAKEGWGRRLLDLQDHGGTWGGGIYTPKWTSTTYTLLLLRQMGLPRNTLAGRQGAELTLGPAARDMAAGRQGPDLILGPLPGSDFARLLPKHDLCVIAMYLGLLVYFDSRDERMGPMLNHILARQMDDGGWNCAERRHEVHHSSLHTTISVLDALAEIVEHRRGKAASAAAGAMDRAHEFMLQHRLFRSDKSGAVIRQAFTKFSFPPRWHYDVLRALDYFRRINAPRDERLQDAIGLLQSKRGPDGRWKLENLHRGKEFFRLETPGQPSRWNTLRALRVLRWWS